MTNSDNLDVLRVRTIYVNALAKLMLDIELELSGVGRQKLAPSSAEFFFEDYKAAMKARVKYAQALTLSGMLKPDVQ